MHVFPSDHAAVDTVAVASARTRVASRSGDSLAGATLDPPELLDVDVDQLAGASSFVALRGLQPEPAELSHPDPGQDPRHSRKRHLERLSDLSPGHPQPSERGDHLDPALVGAVRDPPRGGGAIQQPLRPVGAVPGQPLARGAVTDPGRLGGRAQRPPRVLDTIDQQLAALQTEPGVSVHLHPVSSLGLTGFSTRQPPRSTGWLTPQTGTT